MTSRGLIVMGVAGCGKSTVGRRLAQRLGWDFFDADDFHPPENVARMAAGIPLTDADRAPWLATLNALLRAALETGRHPVLACSALKQRYRDTLLAGNDGLVVVYLKGSYDVIWPRMAARENHYMKPHMLQSQFEALEEPHSALTLDVNLSPEAIVDRIVGGLQIG
jgi:gluconokinase